MKKVVLLIIVAFLFSGCAALDSRTKPAPEVNWTNEIQQILDCSEDYITCLNRAGRIENNPDAFLRTVDKCIAEANKCSDRKRLR